MEVECTFARVTVPNHVHLLHASKGDKGDQAVFDFTYTSAEMRFRPPTQFEIWSRAAGGGFIRAVSGFAPLLFMAAVVLAARTSKELMISAAAFIGVEALVYPRDRW